MYHPHSNERSAGERFVRSAVVASGRFRSITKPQSLGDVSDSNGENRLDLRATDKRTNIRYGISVKNTAASLFPSNRAIKNVYSMAKAHGVRAMLVVPFATEAARHRCQRDGIVLVELGGIVLPSENWLHEHVAPRVNRLRALIGPVPMLVAYAQYREPQKWGGRNPFSEI
jgi:predicted RecB family endonuclease